MSWVCGICSSNNMDSSATCEVCGEPKPAAVEPVKSTSVCTLTQTRAREKCNYADVTVPEEYNVIGEDAFKGRTDLYTIRIHSGVKKIMRGAFEGCTNLYSVYVDGNLSSIGSRAFANCKYLSPERRPTADSVSKDAFTGCSATPIGTPERVVTPRASATKTAVSRTGTTTTRSTGGTGARSTGGSGSSSSGAIKFGGMTIDPTLTKRSTIPPTYTPPTRSTTPPPPPKATTSATISYSTPKSDFVETFAKFPLCFIIALATFVGVFLFTDWGLLATREAWQIAAGLSAVFCIGMLTHHLYYEGHYVAISGVLSVALSVSALAWLFGGTDTTLAIILSVGTATLSFIFSYLAFDEVEEGCGWWMIVVAFLSIINAISLAVRFNYFVDPATVWQVIVAEVVVIAFCVYAHDLIDMGDYEILLTVSVLGFFVTGCILWWFGGLFAHFVSVGSLGLIIINVVGAVVDFDDDETGYGIWSIIFTVMQIGIFALTHLVYI